MRLRRVEAGSYVFDHPIAGRDTHYRIERGWADEPETDRRKQWWMLSRVTLEPDGDYRADILSDHVTLTDARAELRRILQAQEAAR